MGSINSQTTHSVFVDGREIVYHLERKPVKNLNLRVHSDGRVFVSANRRVPFSVVEDFVSSKGTYILTAIDRFALLAQRRAKPREYVSGETICILGEERTLKVTQGEPESITLDDPCIHLTVKDPDDFSRKERLVRQFLDRQCLALYSEILNQWYPAFQHYGVDMPALRLRDMKSRWGSCHFTKGIITLNKRLLAAPRSCTEYVVLHELCHFIHPNHSKAFYDFLAALMPDWRERKHLLDKSTF